MFFSPGRRATPAGLAMALDMGDMDHGQFGACFGSQKGADEDVDNAGNILHIV